VALAIGLLAVNLFRPGVGVALAAEASGLPPLAQRSVADVIVHVFPDSLADAWARNDVLQVVVFALLFGLGAAAAGARARPVLDLCDAGAQILFKVTGLVMKLAPFGVAAALAAALGKQGIAMLVPLAKLTAVFYLALACFVTLLLGFVRAVLRIPLRPFWRAAKEPVLIAFSTSTSEAALPIALERMEEYGVPGRIVGFVLPAGYSFNLDGSTLYLALASVFVAQAAGAGLGLRGQLVMMLTLMLSSKGIAAIPRGSLVLLAGTLASFHLPMEGAALLLGIDAILDMGRTGCNMLGNCVASAVVAKWEGELGQPVPSESATNPAERRANV
ncbi:MAG TPA: dicarboxylate/amino acid:cation symporter, partial [Polyangia bacterium]|nr:dicarboxylate/amino acid:cation symporter [Polyangia bacterium]